jgi:hypothetical protein
MIVGSVIAEELAAMIKYPSSLTVIALEIVYE